MGFNKNIGMTLGFRSMISIVPHNRSSGINLASRRNVIIQNVRIIMQYNILRDYGPGGGGVINMPKLCFTMHIGGYSL
jgi:hypothetical protein